MKKFTLTLLFGSFLFLLFFSNKASASHAAGADISYQCVGGNTDFLVRVAFYRDCAGIGAPGSVTVNIRSASGGENFNISLPQISFTEIVPYCTALLPTECGGSTEPSRQQYIYETTVTLPAYRADWIMSYGTCCRNSAITTILSPGSEAIYAEATLDNTLFPCNSSPSFSNPPAPFVYAGQTYCYNNAAIDLDGDSLVYSLITPRTGPLVGDIVTYTGSYTQFQPLTSAPPMTINPATGDICMTPTSSTEVTVMAVLVQEYRYGTLIGSVMRDIQVNVISGTDLLPTTNGINATNIYSDTIAEGCNYTFTTGTADADATQCLTLASNVASTLMGGDGATFTVSGGCPTVNPRPTGTFNWTPSAGTASNTPYVFVTRLRDNACAVNGEEYKAWSLTVIEFSAAFTSSAPACVNEVVNFYSQYSYSGYSYSWNFGSGAIATFAMSTSQNPAGVIYTTPGAKTVELTITSPSGCTDVVTNVITINPSPVATFTTTAPQCTGSSVSFTNTGTTGAGVTYFWDFGAGATPATSSAQNPAGIIYSTAGSKTVTHTVMQFGCASTDTLNITINQTPMASFSSTAPSCTGSNVDFTNTGTSTGVSWSWSFGAGASPATSTVQNPTGVIYATSGTKVVTLTTTNTATGCTAAVTNSININQTPAPAFTSTAPQCLGEAVTFNYSGTTGTGWTYNWDFGTGATPATSSTQNPGSVVYSTAGTKTITITAINNGLCAQSITGTITINPAPVANFSSTAPSCTDDSVSFLNTGTTGATYAWNFGSGATPATSTTFSQNNVVYSTSGIKTVTLISTIGACSDTSSQTINISQTPAPAYTSTAPQCQGAPVTFNYTGTTDLGWTYNWDFGTGAIPALSSSQTPGSVIYETSGTKTITLTVTNDICSQTITGTIIINPLPLADAGKDTVICNNVSVQIGSSSVPGNTYSWFPTNTLNDASIANSIASPIAPTTIYIVTVTDANGCTASDSAVVTMLSPLLSIAGTDGEICRYDSVQVGAGLITGQNYIWSPTSGLSDPTSPNPITSPDVTTTYTLEVRGPGCGPVMDEVTVIVHQLPLAEAGPNDTITIGSSTQLTATGGVQYSWSPSTGLSNSGINSPVANPIVTTTYTVTITDVFGCDNTDSVTVFVIDASFWVPTAFTPDGNGENDVFYVRGEGINDFQLAIFNRWGEQVYYSTDVKQGWNGMRQGTGEQVPEGAYAYFVKGVLTNGEAAEAKGLINLIR